MKSPARSLSPAEEHRGQWVDGRRAKTFNRVFRLLLTNHGLAVGGGEFTFTTHPTLPSKGPLKVTYTLGQITSRCWFMPGSHRVDAMPLLLHCMQSAGVPLRTSAGVPLRTSTDDQHPPAATQNDPATAS